MCDDPMALFLGKLHNLFAACTERDAKNNVSLFIDRDGIRFAFAFTDRVGKRVFSLVVCNGNCLLHVEYFITGYLFGQCICRAAR